MNEFLLTIEVQPYPCSQSKMSLNRGFWEQPIHLPTPSPTWEFGIDLPSLSDWLRSQSPWPGDLWIMSPMAPIVVLIQFKAHSMWRTREPVL